MMNRRKLLVAFGLGALAAPLVAFAQKPGKVWHIAYLGDGPAATRAAESLEPFREAMTGLGYVEGRNMIMEIRWTEGSAERRTALAAELVRLKPDVMVTHGAQAALALKAATTTIPIVVAVSSDFLGTGLVKSLARPGGNLTGMTDQVLELSGKEVQLIKETLPRMQRVALMWEDKNLTAVPSAESMQAAARAIGLRVLPLPVSNAEAIEQAFEAAIKQRADAMVVTHSPLTVGLHVKIAQLALKKRLAMMAAPVQFTDAGGLISYGPDLTKYFRNAAVLVDKILKGAKPADIPVEQPTKFELVVNMRTAKALGIKIPGSILMRADRVIE
jgi:putative tryptophan/tyrosine transport system substrate-binding protein